MTSDDSDDDPTTDDDAMEDAATGEVATEEIAATGETATEDTATEDSSKRTGGCAIIEGDWEDISDEDEGEYVGKYNCIAMSR
jgi:hypothetical protein